MEKGDRVSDKIEDKSQLEGQEKQQGKTELGISSSVPPFPEPYSRVGTRNLDLKLLLLLADLQALAINCIHGFDKNILVLVRWAFLQFRSLANQKSMDLLADNPRNDDDQENLAANKSSKAQAGRLQMKLPPRTKLPSLSEVKAWLSHFGPLYHLGTHISDNNLMLWAVFLCKIDAESAHRYIMSWKALLGNVNTSCDVQILEEEERHMKATDAYLRHLASSTSKSCDEILKRLLDQAPDDDESEFAQHHNAKKGTTLREEKKLK